ncbi:GGDEF domain-containing protein [Marinicella sp. S1101]|uniref:GGDEF domain-containing protein n=1 Tax=Marinicella marina TaxID=2996016 RepID=UPI002260DA0C|nr:GGDEF domain-containing protein [Marinicella marina]MCX7553944.1 GGDEF domain-containing protein [Marinicella marina]
MKAEIESGYFLNQIYRIRQLALYFALFCLLCFMYLDTQRFSEDLLKKVLIIRTIFQVIPILLLMSLAFFQLCSTQHKFWVNGLLALAVTLVGIGHAEILVTAFESGNYFPKVGLVIILFYAGIILAMPLMHSTISSFTIILYASYSYVAAGLAQEEVLSITVFYFAFSACCLFMNMLTSKMYIHNFKLIKQMNQQANTDNLTKLSNRRYFFEKSSYIHDSAMRESKSFAILLVDLDYFKQINDALGHDQGDQVLKQVAHVLQSHCKRPLDMVARFGGDEFVLLFYDTNEAYIQFICQDIIQQIEVISSQLNNQPAKSKLGVSIGIAFNQKNDKYDVKALINIADSALYEVKKNGKNGYQFADKSMFKDAEISSSQLSLA